MQIQRHLLHTIVINLDKLKYMSVKSNSIVLSRVLYNPIYFYLSYSHHIILFFPLHIFILRPTLIQPPIYVYLLHSSPINRKTRAPMSDHRALLFLSEYPQLTLTVGISETT